MLVFSQERGATSAFKSDAVPPRGAAASIISDEGDRLIRSAHNFFRTVQVFLSRSIDSSPFQEVSLGREVSIIFTSNGSLIYRIGKFGSKVEGQDSEAARGRRLSRLGRWSGPKLVRQ